MTTENGHAPEEVTTENNLEAVVESVDENIENQLEDISSRVRDGAESAKGELARQLQNIAQTIRKEVGEREMEDTAVEQVEKLTDGLDQAAEFLESRTVEEIGAEATTKAKETVTKNPWQTLLALLVVGIVIGVLLRRD